MYCSFETMAATTYLWYGYFFVALFVFGLYLKEEAGFPEALLARSFALSSAVILFLASPFFVSFPEASIWPLFFRMPTAMLSEPTWAARRLRSWPRPIYF